MHDAYYISRNVRALWYFDHLNRIISTAKSTILLKVSLEYVYTGVCLFFSPDSTLLFCVHISFFVE